MENKIRKVIRKQINEMFARNAGTSKHLEMYSLLNDLRDEGHLHRYGIIRLQLEFGLSEEEAQEIYNGYIEDLKLNKEGMSPEEWEAAKEKERLDQHPEKEMIMKIKQMMDKEKDEEQEEWDKGWYGESLKETASKLGYLKEDRQETIISLDDLTFNMLKQVFSDNYKDVHFIRPQTGEPYYRDAISLPNWDDSSTSIGDTVALNHWKEEMSGHYGNVDILLKPEAENWFDKVEIIDDKYKTAKSKFIKGKMSAMQRDQELGRSID